jgi:hypothetical protein
LPQSGLPLLQRTPERRGPSGPGRRISRCQSNTGEGGPGDEGVEDAEEVFAVVDVELGEGGEAFAEAVVVDVQRAAGVVVEDEVVQADVQRLGDAAIASSDGSRGGRLVRCAGGATRTL